MVKAIAVVVALGALGALGACAACQGQGRGGAVSGSAAAASGSATDDDAGAVAVSPSGSDVVIELDASAKTDDTDSPGARDLPDPGRAIAELSAIPAWQAVVDRAQLLARRGQYGVIYGRVGPALLVPPPPPAPVASDAGVVSDAGAIPDAGPAAIGAGTPTLDAGLVASPYVWLIDDTEGNGALGIRIALGDKAKQGDRIAVGGAWQLDAEHRWFWKPDTVQRLPAQTSEPSDPKEPLPPLPSHAIANGNLPAGARTISLARDGDAVYFQIVGPAPMSDGDGWQVADQLGSPAVVVLNLPGERASYGGQDMRAADERWQLKRGQTYWVRIGKLRKRGPDKPTLVNARTAPVRVQ